MSNRFSLSAVVLISHLAMISLACEDGRPRLPSEPTQPTQPPSVPAPPAPPVSLTLIDISADQGPTAGGTYLTIRGSGFGFNTKLTLDGLPARTYYVTSTEIRFSTRPHVAGKVAVVVTASDGQVAELAGGYTYAAPHLSDFNGIWEGRLGDETETAFSFTIQNDQLVSVSCEPVRTDITFLPLPSTSSGEFVAANSRGAMTGGLLRADYATGTISLGECTGYETGWFAIRR